MKRHISILSRALLLGVMLTLKAAPAARAIQASPTPIEFTQPDGTRITLRLRGDEFFHWHEDAKGYTVLREGNRFVYATLNARQRLAPTAWEVGQVEPNTLGLAPRLLPPAQARTTNRNDQLPIHRPWLAPAKDLTPAGVQSAVARGTVRNLVILCRFNDHVLGTHTRPQADYDVLFNRQGGDATLAPSGSVRDAYRENSYGLVDLQSTVLAWVTLPQNAAYYAGTDNGSGTYPMNAKRMVEDALALADPLANFGQFDSDADGYVDAITIIHSGYGAESTGNASDIWSHKGSLPSAWTSADNNRNGTKVKVRDYHTEPALFGSSGMGITRIGVICHELGHFFGLPDLYDTDDGKNGSTDSAGLGAWCMMANSWGFDGRQLNPPHFSAWCKVQLGWVTPTGLTASGTYTVQQAEMAGQVFRISTDRPWEYFLIENRQPVGLDRLIPQGGLAIWHIDEGMAGNSSEGYPGQAGWPYNGLHYKVALMQADGRYDLERDPNQTGDAGDLYHAGGRDHVGPDTVPGTHIYEFNRYHPTGIEIRNISSAGATMQFTYLSPPPAIFVDWDYFGLINFGTWEYPFTTVYTGHYVALDGSDIFIRGAYYSETPLVLNKRVTLHSWDGRVTIGRP